MAVADQLRTMSKNRLGLAADVGGYRLRDLAPGLDTTMYSYLFGRRFTIRNDCHVTPFVYVLAGAAHLDTSECECVALESGLE